jgi:hypothetical protein
VAYFNPRWGYYAHLPKSGGIAFRKHLASKYGAGMEIGKFHDIPFDTQGQPILTTVRNPVDWMASVYSYRRFQHWVEKEDGLGWEVIVNLTQHLAGLSWERFVDAVCERGIDIPYVAFSVFCSRADYTYQVEFVDMLHVNKTPNRISVQPDQRERLEKVFIRSMKEFGYN